MSKLSNVFSADELDPRFVDVLIKALERNNLEGFDYLEFKQSMEALEAMGQDETTAIRSTFATASTLGLTPAKLFDSAAYYQKVLQDEKVAFDASMQRYEAERIEGKRREKQAMQQRVNDLKTKIAELEKQISTAQAKIDSADDEITTAQEKRAENEAGFKTALDTITAQIQHDLNQMRTVLG